jgi:hypothetical protein
MWATKFHTHNVLQATLLYVRTNKSDIKKIYILPEECVYVPCTAFRTVIISLHNINKSVYKPRRSVYSAVRNEYVQATREYRGSNFLLGR